jgi:carbon monoxide dehydrogenase subunit G
MARYVTTVRTSWSPEQAFAYMADLRNFAEWDPGVKGVIQVDGDGAGADASFDVTVAVPGRDMVLRYRTVQFDAPTEVLVIASTGLLTSEDRVSVVAEADGGCSVTYDADLRLSGVLRLADPALRLSFGRIGDRAAAGLRTALAGDAPATSTDAA